MYIYIYMHIYIYIVSDQSRPSTGSTVTSSAHSLFSRDHQHCESQGSEGAGKGFHGQQVSKERPRSYQWLQRHLESHPARFQRLSLSPCAKWMYPSGNVHEHKLEGKLLSHETLVHCNDVGFTLPKIQCLMTKNIRHCSRSWYHDRRCFGATSIGFCL